jgi:hypothetical protein
MIATARIQAAKYGTSKGGTNTPGANGSGTNGEEWRDEAMKGLPHRRPSPRGCVALNAPVLRTPLPRRAGMRRAEGVFPKHKGG